MPNTLTSQLLADALQYLEALRNNETEVVSDQETRSRAEEVAELTLETIAVCTKFLLAENAQARIEGLGDFYLSSSEVRFTPDKDLVSYALLKKQDAEERQRALRIAFLTTLDRALAIIPLLEFESGEPAEDAEVLETIQLSDEPLVESILAKAIPSRFGVAISKSIEKILRALREAGLAIRVDTSSEHTESVSTDLPTDILETLERTRILEALESAREKIRIATRGALEHKQARIVGPT